jgi:hypothetical protein
MHWKFASLKHHHKGARKAFKLSLCIIRLPRGHLPIGRSHNETTDRLLLVEDLPHSSCQSSGHFRWLTFYQIVSAECPDSGHAEIENQVVGQSEYARF